MTMLSFRTPQEEMQQAFRLLEQQADSGDAEARYRLSILYERGYDTVAPDSVKAMRLLTASADSGYLPACNYLGFLLMQRGDSREGLRRIEQAALAGDPKAQGNIGFLLLHGVSVVRDEEKALYWLSRAAEAGVATAASTLGDMYRDGRGGVAPDSMRAAACYRKALDNGLLDAAYKLEALESARRSSRDAAEQMREALYFYPSRAAQIAVPILERLAACDTVSPGVRAQAEALLGDAYSRGIGVTYDHDSALRHYWNAARMGYAPAQFVVAELLEIFPDALSELTDEAPPSAEYLRDEAARQGIHSAADATSQLFLVPDSAGSGVNGDQPQSAANGFRNLED